MQNLWNPNARGPLQLQQGGVPFAPASPPQPAMAALGRANTGPLPFQATPSQYTATPGQYTAAPGQYTAAPGQYTAPGPRRRF